MWRDEPVQVLVAVALDLLLGDPRGWPHIARFTGSLSRFYERLLTRVCGRSIQAGILFWMFVTGTMIGGYWLLHWFCGVLHPGMVYLLEVVTIYQSIAAMDLARHVRRVIEPLADGRLPEARTSLSFIVGRDVSNLGMTEISRAAIEAVAESITDAVVAPLFWAVIAGAPGALLYRVANTLDSIVGHRDEQYEKFGKASARLDDLLNWLPARISALCIAIPVPVMKWNTIRREALTHASPNAGWTEAAMASVLGVRLGGTNIYGGVAIPGAVFNGDSRLPEPNDLLRGVRAMWKAYMMALALLLSWSVGLHYLVRL